MSDAVTMCVNTAAITASKAGMLLLAREVIRQTWFSPNPEPLKFKPEPRSFFKQIDILQPRCHVNKSLDASFAFQLQTPVEGLMAIDKAQVLGLWIRL